MTNADWRTLLSTTVSIDASSTVISFEDCLQKVWDFIAIQRAQTSEDLSKKSRSEMDEMIHRWIDQFIRDKYPRVEGFVDEDNNLELKRLTQVLEATVTGYDVIQPLIDDPEVTEIQGNSYDSIWAERRGVLERARDPITGEYLKFRSSSAMLSFINNLLQVSNSQMDTGYNKCIGNAITPEGYRIAAIGPASMAADKGRAFKAEKSPAFVLRKFSDKVISTENLVDWYSESDQMARFISLLGDNHASVAVAGETGCGKTVNLQTVVDGITDNTRVVSMEKDSELRLRRFDSSGALVNNVIQLEYVMGDPNRTQSLTTNTAENLFNQLMRFTPRTIVFGEVRDPKEIQLAMTAAEAGHNIMFTVHAGSAYETITRLTTAMSKVNPGQQKSDIMNAICDSLDIIIVPAQMKDGTRKVLEVAEVVGCHIVDGMTTPILNTLYEFRETGYMTKQIDEDHIKRKTFGEHVQLNRISDALLKKWARKGMDPEVKQFLTQEVPKEGIQGTYNGKPSPYREYGGDF